MYTCSKIQTGFMPLYVEGGVNIGGNHCWSGRGRGEGGGKMKVGNRVGGCGEGGGGQPIEQVCVCMCWYGCRN